MGSLLETIDSHTKDLRCVMNELECLSDAFIATGNTNMAEKLDDIRNTVDAAQFHIYDALKKDVMNQSNAQFDQIGKTLSALVDKD